MEQEAPTMEQPKVQPTEQQNSQPNEVEELRAELYQLKQELEKTRAERDEAYNQFMRNGNQEPTSTNIYGDII